MRIKLILLTHDLVTNNNYNNFSKIYLYLNIYTYTQLYTNILYAIIYLKFKVNKLTKS